LLEMVVAVREATVVVMAVVMAAVEAAAAAEEVVMLLKRHQKIPQRWMKYRPPVANNRGCVNY